MNNLYLNDYDFEDVMELASAYNPERQLEILDFLDADEEETYEPIPRAPRRHFPERSRWKGCILSYSQEPVPSYFKYFHQRWDATSLLGFTVYQKITSAIRQLAYGVAPDIFDEYLHIGESTSYLCLEKYCKSVIHLFSNEYLKKPNASDVERLTRKHEEIHGFSGMLGSLDCMHWA
ncbi:uncharacterized protein [Rutidosis leptorrhynchoides]|uniref:uncharacterized protein n=1 Tax=Rutidosis leptorrhynchoides TaxID=125765 RepID=UPI003A9A291A